MSTINEKVSIYSELLKKRVSDPNYVPSQIEREAEFYVNNDPTLVDVVADLKAKVANPVSEEDIKPSVVMPGIENNDESVIEDIKVTNDYTDEQIRAINEEINIRNVGIKLEDALANIPVYYRTPIKVYNDFKDGVINQQQREFYTDMTTMYADYIAKKKQEENEKAQKLTLNGEAGIASIFLLSVILFVVAVIVLLNMK